MKRENAAVLIVGGGLQVWLMFTLAMTGHWLPFIAAGVAAAAFMWVIDRGADL